MSVSFHTDEDGLAHQVPMPVAPPPESLPTFKERYAHMAEQMGPWYDRPRPIDSRHVPVEERGATSQMVWLRADGELPDDPVLHTCIATYASDMTLLDTTVLPHGITWQDGVLQMASLDHAMWFHRPFRADRWMLYSQDTPSASGGRGLARGQIFTEDGHLAISVVQEGLIRMVR
jgi:acyl-CoA thioesterase-2